MNNERFYNEVYIPYNEAWKLMKQIKDAQPDGTENEEVWIKFVDELDEFSKGENDTEIRHIIARMLTDMGCVIAKMNME